MPFRKLEQERRLAICSLIIELMQPGSAGGDVAPLDIVVLAAVTVSTFGPHPLSANKIAETTGWPLSNVRRSLKRLEEFGRVVKVGTHYETAPAFRDSVGRVYDLRRKGKAIRRTAARLVELKLGAPNRRPFPVQARPDSATVTDINKLEREA